MRSNGSGVWASPRSVIGVAEIIAAFASGLAKG
jgi:hypothetical protein